MHGPMYIKFIVLLIVNLDARWGGGLVVKITFRPLYPLGRTPISIE